MEKFSEKYWERELRAAKEERKFFFEQAEQSIAVYSANTKSLKTVSADIFKSLKRKRNIWTQVVNTLLPAYFSRKPEYEVIVKNQKKDPAVLVGAIITEKASEYQLEECNDLYSTLFHYALNFVLTGQGVLWPKYSYTEEPFEVVNIDDAGHEVVTLHSKVVDEKVILESLNFDDYLCSVSRTESEVRWKAKRAFLGREEAEERFGKAAIKKIKFDMIERGFLSDSSPSSDTDDVHIADKATFWEIHCRESEKIYFLSFDREWSSSFIEESARLHNLKDFFPCVCIKANEIPTTVVPISDFTIVKDIVVEIERLEEREHFLTEAIRANFAYDSRLGNEIRQLFSTDLQGIPVTNQALTGIADVSSGIFFTNIAPYANALSIITEKKNQKQQELDAALGINDLMRGITNAQESATAMALKHNYHSLRFSVNQRKFAQSIEDAYQILTEIMVEHFDLERLIETSNIFDLIPEGIGDKNPQLMENPQPLMSANQRNLNQGEMPIQDPQQMTLMQKDNLVRNAIALIRDDYSRRYSIGIKTDTMIALDESTNKEDRLQLMDSTLNALKSMEQLSAQYPESVEILKQLLSYALRTFKGHKEVEGYILSMFDKIKMRAESPQAGQPPSPELLQAQAQQQMSQMDLQIQQMKTQVEMQKIQADARNEQISANVKLRQIALEEKKLELEFLKTKSQEDIKAADVMQTQSKIHADLQKEKLDTEQEVIKKL